MDNPLDAVYAFAEQAYIRMQAGDILQRCMEQGNLEPMQELVEALVLAGPQSLGALSEVLSETNQRRAQIQDDMQRLYGEMQNKLRSAGMRLNMGWPDASSFTRLSTRRMIRMLREQGIADETAQADYLERLEETRDMMDNLVEHLALLREIENYLRDWLWGLAYQSARGPQSPFNKSSGEVRL